MLLLQVVTNLCTFLCSHPVNTPQVIIRHDTFEGGGGEHWCHFSSPPLFPKKLKMLELGKLNDFMGKINDLMGEISEFLVKKKKMKMVVF